jgi:hypothetical protein
VNKPPLRLRNYNHVYFSIDEIIAERMPDILFQFGEFVLEEKKVLLL